MADAGEDWGASERGFTPMQLGPLGAGAADPSRLDLAKPQRVLPCLSAPCRTVTPSGEVAVAQLRVGDRVLTRDNGFQRLLWVGRKIVAPDQLRASPQLAPVLIARGALGQGLPECDMVVSAQHRMLFCGPEVLRLFGEHEVLIPAIHLVGLPGIQRLRREVETTYVQLLFAQHEVIRAEGTWCESLQLSQASLAGLDDHARASVLERLSVGQRRDLSASARRCLKREESRLLLQRMLAAVA